MTDKVQSSQVKATKPNLGFKSVSVCVTGIELCNWLTDFKTNLGTGHNFGLVVIP